MTALSLWPQKRTVLALPFFLFAANILVLILLYIGGGNYSAGSLARLWPVIQTGLIWDGLLVLFLSLCR